MQARKGKSLSFWPIGLVFGLMLVMSGCTSPPESLSTPTVGDQIEVEITPVEPTPAGMEQEEDQDQQAAEAEPQETNQCLVCHTDQQALTDTADPEPVVEEESTGEG
jgi:hypothetical protein